MQYRSDRYGKPLSQLGYGCMRFTTNAGRIDIDKAEKEVMAAIEAGVNYFDTAYVYPGSEAALGEILHRNNARERVSIATKLPHYLIRSAEAPAKFFAEELKRLQTDYVDYYLMHMLTDIDAWERLKGLGIVEWLAGEKAAGRIRQVGFSYHGNSDMFLKLLDAYDWDFCQIQYNYMDEQSQAGVTGLKAAAAKGIPVIIMEPLRGGRLVNRLPQDALDIFAQHPVQHTPAQWAFRWLWNQPEVTVVLSGMNSMEMVLDNIATASEAVPGCLTEADNAMLVRVAAAINAKLKVPCTGCRYCMPCPRGVDIPGTFANYNRKYTEGTVGALKEHFMCTALRKTSAAASLCVGCGKCEQHCPQHIAIREELKQASRELEGIPYRVGRKFVEWLKLYG